jgi:hypothetical protein
MRLLAFILSGATAAAVAVPYSTTAVAQDSKPATACRAIKDNAARLKCYDNLPATGGPAAAASPWSITQSKSPLDDSDQVAGLLVATDGEGSLLVRCRETITGAAVSPKLEEIASSWFGSIRVVYRVNDDKPVETNWKRSTTGKAAFAPGVPDAIEFIRSLRDDGKLFVRVIESGGRRHDTFFNLGNVSEIRNRIAVACRWPAAGATR